jgi:monoamine oxidase
MATRWYAELNSVFGLPATGQQLMDLTAPKRAALRDAYLLPDTLDVAALQASERIQALQVVVAGGGLAGLAAAWYLHECGVSAAVFESSERLGGRVRTDRDFIAGKTVEAGAELIGANHPMWVTLAEMFCLPLVEISKDSDYGNAGLGVRLRLGDYDLTPDDKKQVHADLEPVIDAIGRDAANIDPVFPWLSPGAAQFDALSVGQRLDQLLPAAGSLARGFFEFVLGNDNCAPVINQSYLGLLTLVSAGRVGDDTEGLRGYWEYTETHRCGGGNDLLVGALAGQILNDIRACDAVTAVEVLSDRVIFTSQSGRGRCDYFILTAPPTVWPSISSDVPWDPAQRTMAHGPAVKYLNSFDTQFWFDSQLAPTALWDALGSVWESTDKQPTVPGFGLSVYSGGAFVLDETGYRTGLSAIFPGYAPVAERFVDWPHTPGVMTGYSVPAPGQVTTVGQALAEPHGRLYVAGEQSFVGFFGYMEGALQSGMRAAREIIRAECPEAFR